MYVIVVLYVRQCIVSSVKIGLFKFVIHFANGFVRSLHSCSIKLGCALQNTRSSLRTTTQQGAYMTLLLKKFSILLVSVSMCKGAYAMEEILNNYQLGVAQVQSASRIVGKANIRNQFVVTKNGALIQLQSVNYQPAAVYQMSADREFLSARATENYAGQINVFAVSSSGQMIQKQYDVNQQSWQTYQLSQMGHVAIISDAQMFGGGSLGESFILQGINSDAKHVEMRYTPQMGWTSNQGAGDLCGMQTPYYNPSSPNNAGFSGGKKH